MYTYGEEVEQGQAMREAETFRAMSDLCTIGVINGGHSTHLGGKLTVPRTLLCYRKIFLASTISSYIVLDSSVAYCPWFLKE